MCALKTDGTVWCWGDDSTQGLGNGNTDQTDRQVPVQVVGSVNTVAIIGGGG